MTPPRTIDPASHRPRWHWCVVAAVVGVQAWQIAAHSFGRPGFATDFQLLYAVAAAWGDGRDAYDDDVLKRTWAERGDPLLPTPGRPVTPNVYPLTVAPLVWPLTRLPFHAAVIVWTAVVLAAEAWLLLMMLNQRARFAAASMPVAPRGLKPAARPCLGDLQNRPIRSARPIAAALAIAIFMYSYPVRLNLASLNVAVVCGALALAALRPRRRAWTAGVLMGLSLVKYALTGPLLLLMAWRRQYRAVAVAAGVQLALVAAATFAGGYRHPLEWTRGMIAESAASMAPGGINAPDAPRGTAMHLHLRSVWRRVWPATESWHWLAVAALIAAAALAGYRSHRRARSEPRPSGSGRHSPSRGLGTRSCESLFSHEPPADLGAALVLSLALVSFYHRAYDLIPVLALVLGWLVRPRPPESRRRFVEAWAWAAVGLTVVPGLWHEWDATTAPLWVQYAVQPACTWSTLLLCVVLPIAAARHGEPRASARAAALQSGRPRIAHGRTGSSAAAEKESKRNLNRPVAAKSGEPRGVDVDA